MSGDPLAPVELWLPDEIENFEEIANPVRYREGAILFWEGDPSDRLYFIESGQVEMYHFTETGATVTLLIHGTGEIVGLGGVLSGTERRVYAKTLTPCQLWEMSSHTFLQILYDRPRVAIGIATQLSRRLCITDQAVLRVTTQTVDCRLALTLLDLARQKGRPLENGGVQLTVTHQELSNMIGACRQSTTTALGKFKREGILATRKGRIDILNAARLEEIAQAYTAET